METTKQILDHWNLRILALLEAHYKLAMRIQLTRYVLSMLLVLIPAGISTYLFGVSELTLDIRILHVISGLCFLCAIIASPLPNRILPPV